MAATLEEAWSFASKAEGWLTEPQGQLLFELAGTVPKDQAVIEVGSHHGKSTILLALGLPQGSTMTAIDPFDDPRWGGGPESLEAFEANLRFAGVTDRVTLFRGLSVDAARTWSGPKVGLAWIDGAHDYVSVLADLDGWTPHLAPGARLLVHDAFSAIGTTKAVLRRLLWNRHFRYERCERTLLVFVHEDRSLAASSLDALRLSRRLAFFSRMVAIKVARRRHWKQLEHLFMRGNNEPLI